MINFSLDRKDVITIGLGIFCIILGLCAALFDATLYGFGLLTLWFAPILLVVGYVVIAIGIVSISLTQSFVGQLKTKLVTTPWKYIFLGLNGLTVLILYLLTLEPTASFWDCGEYIAAAYKLQIPHTPGNPFFLLVGRLFTMLSFGDTTQVAWTVNLMSAVFSTFTVCIVFLLIYDIARKHTKSITIRLLASSVGCQTLAYLDSFWFSAVEAEIYPFASFQIFLVLWLGTKFNTISNIRVKSRLVLVITYLTAIGYCIHPMCLLIIPSLALVFFNSHKTSTKRLLMSSLIGFALLFLTNKILITWPIIWSLHTDMFLVNNYALPMFSGVVLVLILSIILISFVYHRFVKARLGIVAVILFYIGITPYLFLFIRAGKRPPLNSGSPDNLPAILAFINRDQYGSTPLLYGQYYDAEITDINQGNTIYGLLNGEYLPLAKETKYAYDKQRQTILPRIYSSDQKHVNAYREWVGLSKGQKPKFLDNLSFMFKYQLGHMYLRYVFWNFVGRTGDQQGAMVNWPWTKVSNKQKATNQYWLLPILLSILGAVWLFKHSKTTFWYYLSVFLMNGFILALYLNVTPHQARERDYIYVISFIVLAICSGLGVLQLNSIFKRHTMLIASLTVIAPIILLAQNWNDHNRSNRIIQVEHAKNVLDACKPNAVLITGGDNDTFPIWYLQSVESYRTDVRVIVTSYLNAAWNIEQLREQHYLSSPIQLSLQNKDYRSYGPNDYLPIMQTLKKKQPISFSKYIDLIKSEHHAIRTESRFGNYYHYLPSDSLVVACANDTFEVAVKGKAIYKNDLLILDIIANADERPIYLNYNSKNALNIDLGKHLVKEGLLYRLQPNTLSDYNLDSTYDQLMSANYPNLSDPKIYFNHEDYRLRLISILRMDFNELIDRLIKNNRIDEAKQVAQKAYDTFYPDHLDVDIQTTYYLQLVHTLDMNKEAMGLLTRMVEWVSKQSNRSMREKQLSLYVLSNLESISKDLNQTDLLEKINTLVYENS